MMGNTQAELLKESLQQAYWSGLAWTPEYHQSFLAARSGLVPKFDHEQRIPAKILIETILRTPQSHALSNTEKNNTNTGDELRMRVLENQTDTGFQIDGWYIEGDFDFTHRQFFRPLRFLNCIFTGKIILTFAEIGILNLKGSKFTHIIASYSHINGNFVLEDICGPDSIGSNIDIYGANIEGSMYLNGSILDARENTWGRAIEAQTAKVGQNIYGNNIKSNGGFYFFQCSVGGFVSFYDVIVHSTDELKGSGIITFARESIGDSAFLRNIEVDVAISFYAMDIRYSFFAEKINAHGAFMPNIDDDPKEAKGPSLFLSRMTTGIGITLSDLSLAGQLDLSFATAPTLSDDSACWTKGKLLLDGFTYDRVIDQNKVKDKVASTDKEGTLPTAHKHSPDWQHWRRWLLCQPTDDLERYFKPQPWTQLAKALRAVGDEADAREILFEREQRRPWQPRLFARPGIPNPITLNDWVSWPFRAISQLVLFIAQPLFWILTAAWRLFFEISVGYGYKPERSLMALAIMLGLSWWIFGQAADAGNMIPIDASTPPPSFNAMTYAIDEFIPLVNLNIESYWRPEDGSFASVWATIATIAGWLLTTIAVAGFTGALRKER